MNVLLKVTICEFIHVVFGVLFSVKEEGSVVLEDRLQLAVQVSSVLVLNYLFVYIQESMLIGVFHVSF